MNPLGIAPFKTLGKLTKLFRSRLPILCFKRIFKACAKMIKNPPRLMSAPLSEDNEVPEFFAESEKAFDEVGDVNASKDVWENLINFIDMSEIKSYQIALDLSYLSHLHNKSEHEERNSERKIFTKMIEEELKMRDTDKQNMGVNDYWGEGGLDLKSHTFNPNLVIAMGKMQKKWLDNHFQFDYNMKLKEGVHRKLFNITLESLATFRASAVFNKPLDIKFVIGNKDTNKRRKLGRLCLT
jgi:hypothetical protein